jgi:hypothetical protein
MSARPLLSISFLDYRLSLKFAQPELLVSRTFWLLPRTTMWIVPDTLYSLL